MSKWVEAKQQVLDIAKKMYECGMVTGTSGNVSVRLQDDETRDLIAVTPSSRPYDTLTIDEIQVVDFDVEPVEGDLPPSVETLMHIGIYQARPSVNAVIHTHPVYAGAVSICSSELPIVMEDQATYLGGAIRLADYAVSGSYELAENVIAALEGRTAVLLPHHGALTTGHTLREAWDNTQLLEKTARIFLLANTTGAIRYLPDEGIQAGKAFFAMHTT